MTQNKLLQYYKATQEEKLECRTMVARVSFVYSRHQDAVDDDAFLLMWYRHHFQSTRDAEDGIKRTGRALRQKKKFTRSIMAEKYSRQQQEQKRQQYGTIYA
jgi:hypothetical protein